MKKLISLALTLSLLLSIAACGCPLGGSAVAEAEYPVRFDLRDRGVVTPVKKQDPWNTCWAFAGIAAAEISILSMLKEKGQPMDAQTFDLSEKHLAWFASHPITAGIDPTQAGEGMYMTNQEDVPNITWTNGAYGINVSSLFASGIGPVMEKYFPYQGDVLLTEKQYLTEYPEKGKPKAHETFEEQTGMTIEEFVLNPDAENVQGFLGYLRRNEYLTEADNSKVTVEMLETALVKQYIDVTATENCYAEEADWSIPEYTMINGMEELSRNIHSGFAIVDGNKLPDLFNRDADGRWESINWDGINAVKSELYAGHGVTAGFKADTSRPGEVSEDPLMNSETWAHYTNEDMNTNHMICIIGWDDEFPAANFLEGKQPPADGAWLVKNSWGSEVDYIELENGGTIGYDPFGFVENGKHSGYFWISYYDKSLSYAESMTFDADLIEAEGDLAVLMYDFMPSLVGVRTGQDTSEESTGALKTANVFMNDTGADAQLYSVSTKTARPDATVTYSVYRLNEGFRNPEDGELLGTVTAAYTYAGFHREKLEGSIVVGAGDRFAIVAEETIVENGEMLYEYAVNVSYSKAHAEAVKTSEAENDISSADRDRNADEYGIAVVNQGESFIYENGAWMDWAEYEPRTRLLEEYAIDNFSIKAYLIVRTSEAEKAE